MFWKRLVGLSNPIRLPTVIPPNFPPGAPLALPPSVRFFTTLSAVLPALYAVGAMLIAASVARIAPIAPAASGPWSVR